MPVRCEKMSQNGWLVTHENCLDGVTAAVVGRAAGFTPVFVKPDRVVEGLEQIPDEGPIYLADVSLKLDQWSRWGDRIAFLLDHHQSARPLHRFPQVLIDESRSGAHLFYDYAVQQKWIPATPEWERLCLAVERYDLWKPRHDFGQDLGRLFHAQGYSWYQNRFCAGFTPFTRQEGDLLATLIRQEEDFVSQHLKSAIRYQNALPFPLYGLTLNDEGPINIIAHRLLEEGAALVVVLKDEGRLSARTDTRIDAAQLMESLFCGGGHPRAAGGRLADSTRDDVTAILQEISQFLTHQTS